MLSATSGEGKLLVAVFTSVFVDVVEAMLSVRATGWRVASTAPLPQSNKFASKAGAGGCAVLRLSDALAAFPTESAACSIAIFVASVSAIRSVTTLFEIIR